MNKKYRINWQEQKKRAIKHILRIIFFDFILFFGAYLKGFLTVVSWSYIAWALLLINFIYSLFLLKKYYQNIFLSISFTNEVFNIIYLKNGKQHYNKNQILHARARINISNYSTKSITPVLIMLKIDNQELKFRILLKEMILLFNFIEKNGGTVKKDFDFSCSLKELLSNEEYEDVRNEITELLH